MEHEEEIDNEAFDKILENCVSNFGTDSFDSIINDYITKVSEKTKEMLEKGVSIDSLKKFISNTEQKLDVHIDKDVLSGLTLEKSPKEILNIMLQNVTDGIELSEDEKSFKKIAMTIFETDTNDEKLILEAIEFGKKLDLINYKQ